MARPLTVEGYAPFGAVIAARPTAPRSANHGTAEAWDGLAVLESARPGVAFGAALFRCAPLDAPHLDVRRLERHPRSTQLFAPLGGGRYLLVVARGGDAPDLATLAAFVADGARAITYAPGVWHHPMVALDAPIDFVNLLAADGTEDDCDERAFDPPCARVLLPAR
ncbi:MAG: ureidoglycolate lyase [Sandaracinaceae bacterium]|nr:ureidoglycolate lyase [Sandaracinaceae bacterium]